MIADKYLSKNVYNGIRFPSKKEADIVREALKQWFQKNPEKNIYLKKDFLK